MALEVEQIKELVEGRDIFEYDLETEVDIVCKIDDLLESADVFWDNGAHAGMY